MANQSNDFIARVSAFAEVAAAKKLWLIATTIALASGAYLGRLGFGNIG
jgi:hypothetical protein